MSMTRRDFVRGGVAAFTVGFAAPAFLTDIARAQGRSRRNLVVLYLSGGNDGLSTLIPYTDAQYYARRPTLAIPAASVLQIGSDSGGTPLGLNPRLTDLRTIFNAGRLAIIQRTGYPNSSRSHFQGTDIWSSADPSTPQGMGWLGRYLDRLPAPVDPLTAWSTVRETPRTLLARTVGVPSIANVQEYAFASPNGGADALAARQSATRIASHMGLSPDRIEDVRAASLLHDIGKLEISRELLYKAAQFTGGEFQEVQRHVDKGVAMLETVGGSLRRVIPIVLAHHDKFNGSGYHPTEGEAIPLEARIITVADVYDALTSDRPYRKAMSPFDAKEIVVKGSAVDFDPVVVDAFLAAFRFGEMDVRSEVA